VKAKTRPASVVRDIPKPDSADFDLEDVMERSNYKRELMAWEDNERLKLAEGATA
jgi:hypothetical protein